MTDETKPLTIAEQIAAVEEKRKSDHNRVDIFHNNMVRIIRNRCSHNYAPVDDFDNVGAVEILVCMYCGDRK